MSLLHDPTYKSSFRNLLDISDRAIRADLRDDYYFISKSRMDNYIHCLEQGARKMDEQSVMIAELEQQLQQAQAELASYKQGVEVEGEVYAVAPNGQDVVGKVGIHVPENYIGQRVKVLVRAI